MAPPIGGVDSGGRRSDFSLTDMAAISGSWVSYIFTNLANFRTPKKWRKITSVCLSYQHLVRETFLPLLALHKFILKMTALSLMLTLSFVVEAVGFDNLLLNLGCHREHQLQHLSHVIAGTFSSLLHPCSIFWYWEGLDHLTQYHWEGNKASVIAVLQNILNRAWSQKWCQK